MSETASQVADLFDAETRQNKDKVRCERCNSYILPNLTGVYTRLEEPVDVPSMRQKKELAITNVSVEQPHTVIESEKMSDFWLVNDMLAFENIGFTNTVDKKKFLICADCEIGPIGFQNLDKPNEFLVCISRVKHVA
jgi:hypothetical protein